MPESEASKNKRWIQFVTGLLIQVAIVGYDLYSINECDWSTYSKYPSTDYYSSTSTSTVKGFKIAVMVLSLGEEVLSSLILSCKYNSPLDLKTLHTLPTEMKSSRTFFYFMVAMPCLVYGIISSMVAQVCFYLSKYHGCEGPRSDSLNGFLFFSFIVFFGLGLGFCNMFFLVTVSYCCGSLWGCMEDCWDSCCGRRGSRDAARQENARSLGEHIESSKVQYIRVATMVELSWQFMYLLWAFHAGTVTGEVALTLSVVTVVGICLVAVGSQAFAKESELWIGRMHTAAGV